MRQVPTGGISVKRLDPSLVLDFVTFMRRDAFAEFPWWAGCACGFHETRGDEWDASANAFDEHMTAKVARIEAGRSQGYLAYMDDTVVGWCNAAPRDSYANLRRYAAAIDDTPDVGSIVCFVVAAPYREHGVATALLDAACDGLRDQGMRLAEAYPTTKEPPTQPYQVPWTAHNYHGPLRMYLSSGFYVHRQMDGWVIVRKRLEPIEEPRHDAEDGM